MCDAYCKTHENGKGKWRRHDKHRISYEDIKLRKCRDVKIKNFRTVEFTWELGEIFLKGSADAKVIYKLKFTEDFSHIETYHENWCDMNGDSILTRNMVVKEKRMKYNYPKRGKNNLFGFSFKKSGTEVSHVYVVKN